MKISSYESLTQPSESLTQPRRHSQGGVIMTTPNDPPQKKPLGGNNPFDPAKSSIPLPGGGDTHIDPHKDNTGSTVTTRLPGGDTTHDHFDNDGNNTGGGLD